MTMEKILYLCFACAAAMADGFETEELPGQLKNAKCERCCRRAWGATYRIKAAPPTKAVPRLNRCKPNRICALRITRILRKHNRRNYE